MCALAHFLQRDLSLPRRRCKRCRRPGFSVALLPEARLRALHAAARVRRHRAHLKLERKMMNLSYALLMGDTAALRRGMAPRAGMRMAT